MRYFLGVDAGATKTYALVGREDGTLLALGKGGPGNHQAPGGVERAMACIAQAVDQALNAAGVAPAAIAHAAFCLAGADFPSDYALLTEAVAGRWPGLTFSIHNDSYCGLRAGTSRGWGVVSIAGTGNNQCGIGKDGRELQVGGMGGIYGDFGGAADLGREAIRLSFRADELRGTATTLVQTVLEHMGFATMPQLSEAIYKHQVDWSKAPRLAPKVFAAANAGDAVAQEILIRMGMSLGESAGGVIRQLGLQQDDVEVVLAGSTWKGENPLMIDGFRLAVHKAAPKAKLVRPRYEPVVGAWLLALEKHGLSVTGDVYQTLEKTLPEEIPVLTYTEEDGR